MRFNLFELMDFLKHELGEGATLKLSNTSYNIGVEIVVPYGDTGRKRVHGFTVSNSELNLLLDVFTPRFEKVVQGLKDFIENDK